MPDVDPFRIRHATGFGGRYCLTSCNPSEEAQIFGPAGQIGAIRTIDRVSVEAPVNGLVDEPPAQPATNETAAAATIAFLRSGEACIVIDPSCGG